MKGSKGLVNAIFFDIEQSWSKNDAGHFIFIGMSVACASFITDCLKKDEKIKYFKYNKYN